MKARSRSPALLGACVVGISLSAPSCVLGTRRPPSRVGVARAPLGDAREITSTTSMTTPGCRSGPEPRPASPARDAVWVDGSCHYDGVGYEWIPGRWERRSRVR